MNGKYPEAAVLQAAKEGQNIACTCLPWEHFSNRQGRFVAMVSVGDQSPIGEKRLLEPCGRRRVIYPPEFVQDAGWVLEPGQWRPSGNLRQGGPHPLRGIGVQQENRTQVGPTRQDESGPVLPGTLESHLMLQDGLLRILPRQGESPQKTKTG